MVAIGSTPASGASCTPRSPSAAPTTAASPNVSKASAPDPAAVDAAKLVDRAEDRLDNLVRHVGAVNGARYSLQAENLQNIRTKYGEEFFEKYLSSAEEELSSASQLMTADLESLRDTFEIEGAPLINSEDGEYAIGRFALTYKAKDYAVRIDSEDGPSVSLRGKAFTKDFEKFGPDVARNLPYNGTAALLLHNGVFDIKA